MLENDNSEERQRFTVPWVFQIVERTFRRHGMSKDEEVEFYKQIPIQNPSDYSKPRSEEQLTKDLNVAHDMIRKLIRERDKLWARQDLEIIYRRVLVWALTATWGAIATLAAAVLHYLLK